MPLATGTTLKTLRDSLLGKDDGAILILLEQDDVGSLDGIFRWELSDTYFTSSAEEPTMDCTDSFEVFFRLNQSNLIDSLCRMSIKKANATQNNNNDTYENVVYVRR
jgi:hypothetical protein